MKAFVSMCGISESLFLVGTIVIKLGLDDLLESLPVMTSSIFEVLSSFLIVLE